MKKLAQLILPLLFVSLSASAQDVIITLRGDQIKAKVIQVEQEYIRYKKQSDPDGAEYRIQKSDVFLVRYADGRKEVFSTEETSSTTTSQPIVVNEPQTATTTQKPAEPAPQPKAEIKTEPARAVPAQTQEQKPTPAQKRMESSYFRNRQHLYFSMALGHGPSYGGEFGLRLQGRFGRTAGFGIHSGIGVLSSENYTLPGFSFGLKFFPYKWIYTDFAIGTLGINEYYDFDYFANNYDDYQDWEYLAGPSIHTGVDMIFGKHFGFNLGVGYSYDAASTEQGYITADAGFHFKF